jgi:DNA-binding transcriptional regulator YiaG
MAEKKKMGAPLRFPEPTGDPARDRIIDLRRRLNLSQAALGARLGITESAVRAWETGLAAPSGPAAKLIEQLERRTGRGKPA